jgi:hypothetical protein
MAHSRFLETNDVLSLEEYVEYTRATLDVTDYDAILASAPKLRALMNNPGVMANEVNRQLRSWRENRKEQKYYTSQVFVLHSDVKFTVRAATWAAPSNDARIREAERSMYYYDRPHDHNFCFLTGGYLGAGYETLIYEYDHDAVKGEVGERVDVRFLERTSLPQGKIMFYRASQDIHSQLPASEFSISLNLLVQNAAEMAKIQYDFAIEPGAASGSISGYTRQESHAAVALCDIAARTGDGRTATLLGDIATTNTSPNVRAQSYISLAMLDAGRRSDVIESALRDRSELVRDRVLEALAV